MAEQNFANHPKMVPLFHYFVIAGIDVEFWLVHLSLGTLAPLGGWNRLAC